MKTVVLTYRLEFPNEVPDDICIKSAIEVMSQDSYWPDDEQIQILKTDE